MLKQLSSNLQNESGEIKIGLRHSKALPCRSCIRIQEEV